MKKRVTVIFMTALMLISMLPGIQAFAESSSIKLKTFSSDKYPEFSCGYPENFEVYDDYLKTLYTVRSKDKKTSVQIDVVSQGSATVSSEKDKFIKSLSGGKTEYNTSGSDYYAVRILKNGVYNYVYCKFKNGNMYSFAVQYTDATYGDNVVNAIYKSFTVVTPSEAKSKKTSSSSSSKSSASSSSSKSSSSSSVSSSSSSSSSDSSGGFPLKPKEKEYCNRCRGTRKIDCPSCGGSGGKKVRSGSVANYSGKSKSSDRYTEKWEDCFRCRGRKTIDCPNCS